MGPRHRHLQDWLDWQETLHPTAMDLGLERVRCIAERMGWPPRPFPLVTVAGTNGKGSTVAYLEAMLKAAGLLVGSYTSPHLVRYNERIRIDAEPSSDAAIMAAFERLDAVRGDMTLTYFEFGTLAAMHCFHAAAVDVAVMEVGIGGRLDAVNVFDADIAVVTTVDLDHQKWLGDDRESIGAEKAGILRAGRPAVSGERQPPAALRRRAVELGAPLHVLGEDYDYTVHADGRWDWRAAGHSLTRLPAPALAGRFQYDNAAAALMAASLLDDRLAPPREAVEAALCAPGLAGRFQVLARQPLLLVDVAHNRQATAALADNLRATANPGGRDIAVCGMLVDKDLAPALGVLADLFDAWFVCGLPGPRGDDGSRLQAALAALRVEHVQRHPDVPGALAAARALAAPQDRIVAFGSFMVVGTVLEALAAARGDAAGARAPGA